MSAVENEEDFDAVTALKTDNGAMREEIKFAHQQLNSRPPLPTSSHQSSGDLQPPVSQQWPESLPRVPLSTDTRPKRWARRDRGQRAFYEGRRNNIMQRGGRGGRGGKSFTQHIYL
ncbi:hypothetical protein PV325_012296 [Microctonus aethiopoides]|uniref:Uncharacterized protein n=1 Tax=Microctonus aethiopoides TaxID=144406 RepID=A0AA39FH04_9HYME|nr:hypothetical protein PV325_012296 [Microctonus aethiopoides]KAK0072169.1 hypothetical protein PV326_000359 [Microctonus aethiopoides]KAK0169425.1 hypothetical protein PV328_012066 [Microctonus aethiopoides]